MLDHLVSWLFRRQSSEKQNLPFSSEHYEWKREISKDETRKEQVHYSVIVDNFIRLSLFHSPGHKGTYGPLSEEERKIMWHPEVKGPKETFTVDTVLKIDDCPTNCLLSDGFIPRFLIYLLNGKYQYGEKHSPGYGDLRSLLEDFHTVDAFKKEIGVFLEVPYSKFSDIFTKSNLPIEFKDAVKPLLQ